jgi:cell division septum initiation protein DivIVA
MSTPVNDNMIRYYTKRQRENEQLISQAENLHQALAFYTYIVDKVIFLISHDNRKLAHEYLIDVATQVDTLIERTKQLEQATKE